MLIKLHFYEDGKIVWINLQNVCSIFDESRHGYEQRTCIQMSGGVDCYYYVRESLDEIFDILSGGNDENKAE